MHAYVIGNVAMDETIRVDQWPMAGASIFGSHGSSDLGGKGANQAVVMARCGLATTLVAPVGEGFRAQSIAGRLAAEPVETRLVPLAGRTTDFSIIFTTPDGENAIVTTTDAAENLRPEDALPALKAAAPESPMIDGWMGDDWFHYGAFRLANIGWLGSQTGFKGAAEEPASGIYDDYDRFRRIGSAGAWAEQSGYAALPYWQRMVAHPSYDAFWQGQALDKLVAANPWNVPTMWEQGLWDQEDMYGAIHTWEALKAKGKLGNNFLVMGPWRHSQANYDGSSLGDFKWNGDTATEWREKYLFPFFDQYLRDGQPAFAPPQALIYNTGENHWDRFAQWPLACEVGCAAPLKPIYLEANGGLGFDKGGEGGDSYVSDPAKPVPHLPRPVNFGDGRWGAWLVQDQRSYDGRPDVMTYQTAPLTQAMRVSGPPIADLFAKTTGTDGDFVVKVIDVYPDQYADEPKKGGYQLAVSLEIFRGRYRDSFEHPSAIPAGKVQRYRFRLPTVNHVFEPGHRIMVQVQSTLFPLYDRNPQKYVPNIFLAKPGDYQKATVTLMRGGAQASAVWLPVVPVARPAEQ